MKAQRAEPLPGFHTLFNAVDSVILLAHNIDKRVKTLRPQRNATGLNLRE